jgi:hypothetical protein
MNQESYFYYRNLIKRYKNIPIYNSKDKDKLNKYILKISNLLDNEYDYGLDWVELIQLDKYIKKCKKITLV